MQLDYAKQNEEGKGLENVQGEGRGGVGGYGCMNYEELEKAMERNSVDIAF